MNIKFFGATREVTGSCALITAGKHRILVDCGLVQGSHTHESHNEDAFPFDPKGIDAVVVTHAHIDHSGRTPLLVKRGYKGPIFSHHATVDLCQVMLSDAGFLNEREAAWRNRTRRGRTKRNQELIEPLYTMAEAETALNQFNGINYDETREILPGIKVVLRDAGHILGAAIVEITITESGQTRKILFSGDLGHSGAPILREPTAVRDADLVVMESTYGDRLHRPWDETWQEMGEIFSNARSSKGNILIPAFTVGRTQELLLSFKRHFTDWGLDHWQIFLDSPMAIEATAIYEKHWRLYDNETRAHSPQEPIFDLPNLHLTQSTEDSMGINMIRAGAIIIAGSGMCTGGRISHHLQYNVSRHNSHVLIVGFQARGTPGRALVDGAEQIRLFGKDVKVNAHVHTVGGLSAHADQQGLLDWYDQFDGRPPVKLVHGEETAMTILRQRLEDDYNSKASLAEFGERLQL